MIKSVTQHHILRRNPMSRWLDFKNNPTIGWVHPKVLHACPLAWANKLTCKPITLSIQPTFNFSTPIPAQKVFPQCLCRTESIIIITFFQSWALHAFCSVATTAASLPSLLRQI